MPDPSAVAFASSRARARARGGALRAIATALIGCAAVLLGTTALRAQGAPHGFLLRSGADTFALERVTFDGATKESELYLPAARTRIRLRFEERAGDPRNLTLRVYAPGAAADRPPTQTVTFSYRPDSIIATIAAPNGAVTVQRLGRAPGALLFVNPSMTVVEGVIARARAMGDGAHDVPVVMAQGGARVTMRVEPQGDSVIVTGGGAVLRARVDRDGRMLGADIPAQQLRVDRIPLPTDAAMGYAPPDYSAPVDAPYVADSVRIPTREGRSLAATLTRPRTARGRLAVVVTISGSGPQDRDGFIPVAGGYRPFRDLADTLARRGIAVLRFDDRGVGGSTGDFSQATSADFADDVRAIVTWLRTRPDIDT
ncbi:MAG: hypothetical protein MUE41_11045, partial [Gemmatimonadaceae bacterium]|nr:hypothetical protein [Gemmatimonadaceae bacterium]